MDPAQYVDRLASSLVGPRRVKRDLLREVADHLEDARDAYVRAGSSEDEAGARAVADFGAVPDVAPGFQATLAVASSRRTAVLLLAILALQPFVWDSGLASRLGFARGGAEPSGWVYAVLDAAVEYGGGLVLVAAVLLTFATGVGHRWIRPERIARTTGWFALGAVVLLPLIGLAMATLAARGEPGHWLLLVGLLMVPMAGVGVSARRTLAAV